MPFLKPKDIKRVGPDDPEDIGFYARCPQCRQWASVPKNFISVPENSWVYLTGKISGSFCFNHIKHCGYHKIVSFVLRNWHKTAIRRLQ